MKHKKVWIISVAILMFAIALVYYFCSFAPHQQAVQGFEQAKEKVLEKNKDIDNSITEAQNIIKNSEKPLELQTLVSLEEAIEEAQKVKRNIPKIAQKTTNIQDQTKELEKPLDYTENKTKISDALESYKKSIAQLKQITNPSQSFVEERLKEVPTITEVQAVTENQDPNGRLNKQGGYTASIYFADSQVNQTVEGASLIDKGNDAGGNIEVYSTIEDAEKRNTYLSSFDGGASFLDPGSHYVYGTIVIRTSSKLTATQQQELTDNIYHKLIELK